MNKEKLKDFWYNVKKEWRYIIKQPFRSFIQGIKNLIKWFPIIWKDRDWDWRYIFDILQKKLENQANWTEKHGIHLDKDNDVKWMRICVKLIEKVKNEEYEIEYMDYEEKEWKMIPYHPGKDEGPFKLQDKVLWENYDGYFSVNKLMHKKTIEYLKQNQKRYCVDYTDKALQAHTLSKLKHIKARRILFSILNNKIESFWD